MRLLLIAALALAGTALSRRSRSPSFSELPEPLDENSIDYVEPEHVEGEWNDDLGDYTDGVQAVDLRASRFDGRPIHLLTPNFGDGETDLWRAFTYM